MALQGDLKDFSITEIIQLIGQQFKTGVLNVQHGRKKVEISFVDGMIVHVFSNYRSKKDLLGEILVKAQVITQRQLDHALKLQGETLQYLGEILIDLKWLKTEEVLRVIQNQIYETIYDLFRWGEGSFRFDLRLVERYRRIPLALSPENVLLNVLRILDEWPEIEKKISSPYIIFEKVPAEEIGDRYNIGEFAEKISAEGEVVHGLMDGRRTVQEIIDRSLLGKYNVFDSLVKLEEGGLIRRVGIERPGFGDLVSGITLKNISLILRLGVLFAIICLLVIFFKPFLKDVVMNSRIKKPEVNLPRAYSGNLHRTKIMKALEIYRMESGEYPEDLQRLVSSGILADWDLYSEDDRPYRYKVTGDGRISLSP
ncbi:MAG: DUF4388 domain-containing protein [Syntrophobacterales bacterium]|nr:MAG: DUF4388 domain-containing protein [Syntrophobacterales bacterium]